MTHLLTQLWFEVEGQDVAEYAVMLGVILAMLIGVMQLAGAQAGNIFSRVASSLH